METWYFIRFIIIKRASVVVYQCLSVIFLSDRYFKVRVGNTYSDPYSQEAGVPQGSILSVTLFSLKINSSESCLLPDIKCSLYVDLLLVVSLHQSDPLSDTFFCDIVVYHEIIKRPCLLQQRALEEMLHRLISFFTITRGVILICIFPLS